MRMWSLHLLTGAVRMHQSNSHKAPTGCWGALRPLRGQEVSLCDQVECDRKEQGRKVEVGWDKCP